MAETYVCTVARDSEIVETNTFTRTLTGFDSEQRLCPSSNKCVRRQTNGTDEHLI